MIHKAPLCLFFASIALTSAFVAPSNRRRSLHLLTPLHMSSSSSDNSKASKSHQSQIDQTSLLNEPIIKEIKSGESNVGTSSSSSRRRKPTVEMSPTSTREYQSQQSFMMEQNSLINNQDSMKTFSSKDKRQIKSVTPTTKSHQVSVDKTNSLIENTAIKNIGSKAVAANTRAQLKDAHQSDKAIVEKQSFFGDKQPITSMTTTSQQQPKSTTTIARVSPPESTTSMPTTTTTTTTTRSPPSSSSSLDRDILVRAAKGQQTERTAVWLMRQAGRYMADFRQYSDKYGFRQRSETPDIAIELSLQCHRRYGMDGIIMFSDILTPLPTLNIDFDVIKGKGPVISTKVESEQDVLQNMPDVNSINFDEKLPFIRDILTRLAKQAEQANTSLIGFVGAPFTLASYTIEGESSKHCLKTKKLMMADSNNSNKCMSLFLDKLSEMIGNYACHQIECGAQVIQVFESWAHQCSPKQFEEFAKPAAKKAIAIIKEKHPDVPVIYFANGGSSYLELQRDMGCDMIAVDWHVDMATAREILGPDVAISGNIDPTILFGSKQQIEEAVRECIDKAGGPGKHLLNLGHGVMQGTPEEAVGWLVDECKRYRGKLESS